MAKQQQQQNGKRADYVEFGSEQHAEILQIRKAIEGDDEELIVDGWTFVDFTQYGPNATPRFLKAILGQRVRELNAKPAVPQSTDRAKANYAPPMFHPDDFRQQSVAQSEIDEALRTLKRANLI